MEQPCNFNLSNNAQSQLYRHKARTFQPRVSGISDYEPTNIPREKCYLLNKFLTSTMPHQICTQAESAKYANMPPNNGAIVGPGGGGGGGLGVGIGVGGGAVRGSQEPPPFMYHHQHPHAHPAALQHPSTRSTSHHHQHMHTRSQSHSHYYHTMVPGHCPSGDYYYNLPIRQTPIGTSRTPPHTAALHHVNGGDPPPTLRSPPMHHSVHGKMDPLKIMEVCNEISETPIDSCPPIPKSRAYTVVELPDRNLYKLRFPQKRYITNSYTDPVKKITLPKNHVVTVVGPSQSDRSKFTVCCMGCCDQIQLDIQHQLTKMIIQ